MCMMTLIYVYWKERGVKKEKCVCMYVCMYVCRSSLSSVCLFFSIIHINRSAFLRSTSFDIHHTYIHTYTHTYIHIYIHIHLPQAPRLGMTLTDLHTYIPTYLHTYSIVVGWLKPRPARFPLLPPHSHTYLPTYIHTYLPTYLLYRRRLAKTPTSTAPTAAATLRPTPTPTTRSCLAVGR